MHSISSESSSVKYGLLTSVDIKLIVYFMFYKPYDTMSSDV